MTALFVDFLSCCSLKVAFGHLSLNDPGVLVCVEKLDATLVYWVLRLCVACLSCRFLKVSFGHLFLNDPGVLVCVVNWMLLLSVGCYPCVLHACVVVF